MTTLLLILALAQAPLYRWEDSGGTVHFSAERSSIPPGVRVEVLELGPIEKNGLMPAPEPVLGPYSRPEWRAKFAELNARRLTLSHTSRRTTRQCQDRNAQVTVPGRGPTQTQVFIHDCPASVACQAGHWAWVALPAQPPQTATVVVQDCVDTVVVSAQFELTEGFVALREDEAALTKLANQYAVPQAWREP